MPEAFAAVRALDKPWNVGDDTALAYTVAHDAEIGHERRERIIGDLRPRGRDDGDERRFTRVRQTDDADVGEQPELDLEREFFAGEPGLNFSRAAVRRRDEARVASAALAAVRDDHALAGSAQIGQNFAAARIADDRADRHRSDFVLAAPAVLVLAAAVLAAAGAIKPLIAEIEQRREIGIGHRDDVAAGAPVAAVGPAARDVFFAAKAHAAASAVAGFDLDFDFVDEFHKRI